jgi:hypothetical protein
MAATWYVTRDGKKLLGPYSSEQLKQLAASGKLKPTDMLRKGNAATWMPASRINGLFDRPPTKVPKDAGSVIPTAQPSAPASSVQTFVPTALPATPTDGDNAGPVDLIACPHCHGYVPHDGRTAGSVVACPHCGNPFSMPAMSPTMNAAADDDRPEFQAAPPQGSYWQTSSLRRSAVVIGAIVAVLGILILVLMDSSDGQRLIAKGLSEEEARNKLKEALDKWVFGDYTSVTPSMIFLDSDHMGTHVLMKYEIVNTRRGSEADTCEVVVILTFQSRAGTEIKKRKVYKVMKSNKKGAHYSILSDDNR